MLLGILIINVYNKLIFNKKKVLDKFRAINDCLNERISIIKEIVTLFENNKFHEDSLIRDLNNISNNIETESVVNNLLDLISSSDIILKKALTLENVYPELIKNNDYKRIVDAFKNNQYKIMYAIEIYNEEVEVYNNYKDKKMINIISKIFRFKNYNYYKK